ncbi:hypothetical protein PRVXH_001593 [Proteinivorax hydrogeniformans]|uniref:Uncharacterized protein n=1 Tax=Proteinivorax hydrogeniformans TaxID=1826727 RepID=A0AAU8HPY9_9FIRM
MLNVYYQGEQMQCETLLSTDNDLRKVLNILQNVNDKKQPINLHEIGATIFDIASSYSCIHGMDSVQKQALANLGYILFTRNENTVSREHLYEKIFLTFFEIVE